MKNKSLIITTAVLLSGCLGRPSVIPTHFYRLNIPSVSQQVRGPISQTNVAIESVTIPQSVARPQIVISQSKSTECYLAEFDRWIENLDSAIPVAISENMNSYAKNIAARPGRDARRNAKYIVNIEIVRFETASDGDTTISAWWTITDTNGKTITQKRRTFQTQTPHKKSGTYDYDAIVATHSRLIADLSYKISDSISDIK